MVRTMYHTQGKREAKLTLPIICTKSNAWLGEAYYYWYSENDAVLWGNNAKRKYRYYEIYKSEIKWEGILDTVFNEEHYLFWLHQIEKVAEMFLKKGNSVVTLKEVNDYFKQKGIWTKLNGIMFQDISSNDENTLITDFHYKKRIQLAVYNLAIITNFALHYEGKCV